MHGVLRVVWNMMVAFSFLLFFFLFFVVLIL